MTRMISCIVIDDEPLARQLLLTFLSRYKDIRVIGEAANPLEAYELINSHTVDVLFLDIRMPVISGIDFIKSLKNPPHVIFTTAYSDHAVTAFEANAVDYIVKPITEERFDQALQKLRKVMTADTQSAINADFVFFKVNYQLVKVFLNEIRYLEAHKDYSRIVLSSGKELLVGSHLKSVLAMLPAERFIRVHRSYVVPVNSVVAIGGSFIEVEQGIKIPLGDSYKAELQKTMGLN